MTGRVFVTSAEESSARDAAAIAAGVSSRVLMQRAGAGAAAEILRHFPDQLARGVAVFAGTGNNGGDAWAVAGRLAAAGITARVQEIGAPGTADALAEREHARPLVSHDAHRGDELMVVDGLLGTGARGRPRAATERAIHAIAALRQRGAVVAALDVPSGVDATTGAVTGAAVSADLTLTFGTLKRGLLVARALAGAIEVVDIGLGSHADLGDGAARLVDRADVVAHVPPLAADAHKGARKHVAIIGGATGMAGAPMLAARGAMASGVGMLRLLVAPESLVPVQIGAMEATARPWPMDAAAIERDIGTWADCVLLGPGLGRGDASRTLAERVLSAWRGPVVLDADALNIFEHDTQALADLLGGRPALLTPHAAEMSRLMGCEVADVLERRFEIGAELSARLGATILLKGVPTIISGHGERWISARGTPALGTAGSGDVLAGIAATLLAQGGDALVAGRCAAWAHGRAAEIAGRGRPVRGVRLSDVLDALSYAWPVGARPHRAPVFAALPAVDGLR